MADAGRVIAGSARAIRLVAPGGGTRPLADRLKQTLFAILEPDLAGARVLDLFAGSGAAGIEALSRGAASAVFVERDARAVTVIRENLERTRLAGPRTRIVRLDALSYLRRSAVDEGPFDIVILDPPYGEPALLLRALDRLGTAPEAAAWLSAGARVVAKHFWRDRPPDRIGLLASERERRSGESALSFFRAMVPPAADEEAKVEAG